MWPNTFFFKINTTLFLRGNNSQKYGLLLKFSKKLPKENCPKKLPKENDHPICENSPNRVTLSLCNFEWHGQAFQKNVVFRRLSKILLQLQPCTATQSKPGLPDGLFPYQMSPIG
jgi:hypothetical protein